MTITISLQAWEDLQQEVNETVQYDPFDPLDVTWQLPQLVGYGYMRWIELRQGLELEITNFRLCDRLILDCPELPSRLKFHCHLSGQHEDKLTSVGDREFALYGSGLAPKELNDGSRQKALEVTVYMQPE
ncbi:AraC family transcriptional regulator, partial [Chroococcidiopsidales cyanobacterium LEGE 13417]|nr:AraC family transcriptional regulator [Chroococcidiopsidales cyanobacterium LEGE 13417]